MSRFSLTIALLMIPFAGQLQADLVFEDIQSHELRLEIVLKDSKLSSDSDIATDSNWAFSYAQADLDGGGTANDLLVNIRHVATPHPDPPFNENPQPSSIGVKLFNVTPGTEEPRKSDNAIHGDKHFDVLEVTYAQSEEDDDSSILTIRGAHVTDIPTASPVGLLALICLLGLSALYVISRRSSLRARR